jgi:hypothetical protein
VWAQKSLLENRQKLVPIALSSSSAIPPVVGCQFLPAIQPTDSIAMNTVISKEKAKTIHVEKESFVCAAAILDVSTFTEIIENLQTQKVLSTAFEVVTCAKTFSGNIMGCEVSQPLNQLPSSNCSDQRPFLRFPIEMNTVVGTDNFTQHLVKTIESEKEVFKCNLDSNGNPTKLKDVTIFTEIFENLDEMKILNKKLLSTICVEDILSRPNVTACSIRQII